MKEQEHIHIGVPPRVVEHDPTRLRWGVVSTVKASRHDIARFSAHHLALGAAEVHLFLDAPDRDTFAFLSRHPRITVTSCDDSYWQTAPDKARSSHQLRQAWNATQCYKVAGVHWLAHIDVDEFILSPTPVTHALAAVPDDVAAARLLPAEMLAQENPWSGPCHFKLPRPAGDRSKRALADIYPTYGPFLREGFLSHISGKVFARTGLRNIRLGIHAMKRRGLSAENEAVLDGLHVGHAHAPSWTVFERHAAFRLSKGSYRKKPNEGMMLSDILQLASEDKPDGVRHFFDEICAATPRLLDRLAAHDMLLTGTLDLDAKVAAEFGQVPQ
ncbi:glycosyltransferase family 2 protein [Thalassococcus sp. S3]|uniref:glycosyltransferase family 2 protein n=1 Tax=Thalassococcus sp. S3 TaxID=2017482 RepID=UPI0010240A97|nr:glycosyltransferase family 2 protein [Thalassococcus sp. S3]QBF31363.1 glycosyl transferase family 2 [Thalassococcus sp. S3]